MASTGSENSTSTVPLKLFLDKKKTRVLAAEATSDFVDALLGFLTLPMGTIMRVTNHHPGCIGCFNNMYKSIEELSANKFSTEASKSMLLNHPNPSADFCKNLKLNIDDTSNGKCYSCPGCSKWSHYIDTPCCLGSLGQRNRTSVLGKYTNEKKFVESKMMFLITDDLRVQIGSPSSLTQLLLELKFADVRKIVEISVDVGLDKVTQLLKRALLSKTPLTDVFVERQDRVTNIAPSNVNFAKTESDQVTELFKKALLLRTPLPEVFAKRQDRVTNIAPSHVNFVKAESVERQDRVTNIAPSHVKAESEVISIESKLNIKLLITEMGKEILAVEAGESFVDFIFSLCTIPLGSFIKVLDGDSGLGCIDVLYKTVESLDPKLLNIPKKEIMDCGVLKQYKCNSMLLQVTTSSNDVKFLDPRNPNPSTECFGKFLKDDQLFVISNNLIVKPSSLVSSISLLKEMKVHANDVKVMEVAIGGNEILALMKASLTSPFALDALKIFLEDKKSQTS